MIPVTQRSWALALAGGCALWAGLALGRSERMAALIGSTPSEVRALGIRDLGSGVLLAASPDARLPIAIALRVAFDVSDAARYGRGRPAVLAMTLGFAGLGVAGLLARRA